jgi:UDP:flavonoid glycosyltransferase YjiC (YdhE family)
MARILLTWELGAGYGHMAPLRLVAQALNELGHQCVFALRHLRTAEELRAAELGPVLQAPAATPGTVRPVRVQLSYASLLHNVGCGDPVDLAARLRAWMELMQAFEIDAVIADHAPFSVLAARTLGLPHATRGCGFSQPPPQHPFPPFAPGRIPADVLARNEDVVLGELNAALERIGTPPLQRLAQILDNASPLLMTYPELDPYAACRAPDYLGVADTSHGADPDWPPGQEPRLFAYLLNDGTLKHWLQALVQLPVRALVRVAGAPVGTSQYPRIRLVSEAVHTRRAMESCDLAVSYSPHATVAEALLAGKPQVLVPKVVEQGLTARAVQSLGAAVIADGTTHEALARALHGALADATLRAAAADFAQRHRYRDRTRIIPDAMAALCQSWWR